MNRRTFLKIGTVAGSTLVAGRAEAAEKGDMVAAANLYGAVTAGCVACHIHFRGQPGATAYVPRLRSK